MNTMRSFRGVFSIIFLMAVLMGPLFTRPGFAKMASPGKFVSGPVANQFPKPKTNYKTDLIWLLDSYLFYKTTSEQSTTRLTSPVRADRYITALKAEIGEFQLLSAESQYLYKQLLIRDIAKFEIKNQIGGRSARVFDAGVTSMVADAAAIFLTVGIRHCLPRERLFALQRLFEPTVGGANGRALNTQAAYVDFNLRYREFLSKQFTERLKRQMMGSATDAAVELTAEATISAALATSFNNLKNSPDQLLKTLRSQITLDIAAWQCACILDTKAFLPPSAWFILSGPRPYRTKLGYILSLILDPPPRNILNIFSGGTVIKLLNVELKAIHDLQGKKQKEYSAYLRRFLTDLETLEALGLERLKTSASGQFFESWKVNLVIGGLATASGVGAPATVASILANAGYAGLSQNAAINQEVIFRTRIAALRESALDQLAQVRDVCGCGQGITVVPKRITKGKVVK